MDGLPPKHGHEHETEYESEHEAEHESEHEHEHEHLNREDVQGPQITAFFLRTKNRVQILALQREINVYKGEALLAIIPGVALAELWKNLNYVEKTLTVVSVMVIFVGFVAMLIAILTSLNERRREMAILRSLGLSSEKLIFLFVLESALLTFAGLILGYALSFMLVLAVGPWAEREFGVYISNRPPTQIELLYLLGTFVIGILIGLLPALRARNMALKDGLSQRL
ncbi:MAG: ABC transporter permease [Pseudobdellovibrionaceae bacterium]